MATTEPTLFAHSEQEIAACAEAMADVVAEIPDTTTADALTDHVLLSEHGARSALFGAPW